jgi:hypothetical protein
MGECGQIDRGLLWPPGDGEVGSAESCDAEVVVVVVVDAAGAGTDDAEFVVDAEGGGGDWDVVAAAVATRCVTLRKTESVR